MGKRRKEEKDGRRGERREKRREREREGKKEGGTLSVWQKIAHSMVISQQS